MSLSKLKWREKRQDALIFKTKEHQFTLLDIKKNLKELDVDALDQDFNVAETLRDSIMNNSLSPKSKYQKSFLTCSTFRNYWPRSKILTKTRNFFDDSNQNKLFFKFNPNQADIALMPQNIKENNQINRKMTVNSLLRKKELLKQISEKKVQNSIYSPESNGIRVSREFRSECKETFFITRNFNKSSIKKSIQQNTFDFKRMENSSSIFSENSELQSPKHSLFNPEDDSGQLSITKPKTIRQNMSKISFYSPQNCISTASNIK